MSSIAAIGELGHEKDVALLESLRDDPESRIRRVAEYNLLLLHKRIEQGGSQ